MRIELVAHDHHRNGVSGIPFQPCLFKWKDEGVERNMLGILVDSKDYCGCMVLDVDMAADGNIRFFENSWRGDHFEGALRKAIDKANANA